MNNFEEREIDLKDLAFFIFSGWKLYLLTGLIGLVLLGAFRFYKTEQARLKNEQLTAEGREAEVINSSEYQAALDALDKQQREIRKLEESIAKNSAEITKNRNSIASNNDRITAFRQSLVLMNSEKEEVERKLEELQSYMQDSILLNIDATAKPESEKVYQVVYSGENTEALFRDPADEILAAYAQNITLIGAGSGLEEKYGIPEKYFDETFSVRYDTTSNQIFVTATGTDRQMAEDICGAVCKLIEGRKAGLDKRYHAHALETVRSSFAEIVDEALANTQSSRFGMVNSYRSQIVSYDTDILTANTSIDNTNATIQDLEQQITVLTEATDENQDDIDKIRRKIIEDGLEDMIAAKAPSRMRSIKDGLKFGIIGAVILAVLAAGVYCVIYLLDGKLHTASELSFGGSLPVLAELSRPAAKKKGFIDRWIWRGRNRNWRTGNEEALKTAAVSIAKLTGEGKRIAVLSSLNADALTEVAAALNSMVSGVEFVPVADSFRCSANAALLDGADGVILYEKRDVSKTGDILAELNQAELLGKNVIGSIVA